MGTNITLKVDPTKSAEASSIAIEMTKVLHIHNIAAKYNKATAQIAIARAFIHQLEVPGLHNLEN